MYPETVFHTIRQKIKKSWSFAFRSAFCMGLIIHMYRLTNHLLTWDSVYNFHDSQNKADLGRCFLTISCGIGSYYDLQWINGLLSLLYLSLTCVCVVEIFSLHKKSSIFFVCGLTVSFPVVASTFAYMYTADGYFLAQLTAALAVLVTLRYQKGFLAGLTLLAFSYGSYQAYVSYAVMLIVTWSILRLIDRAFPVKELLAHWGRFLLMGGAGTALYLLSSRILGTVQGISTSDYNGISTMTLPGVSQIVSAVKNCLIDFVYFFFGPLDTINLYKLLNAALFILILLLFLFLLQRHRLYRDPGRLLLLLVCFGAMPFVCSMIYFLSPQVRYYMLMYAGFTPIYMLPALLYDSGRICPSGHTADCGAAGRCERAPLILAWSIVSLTALTIFNFALIDNISYLYMTTSNRMTFDLTSRMTDRIERLEDFPAARKFCIVGHFDDYDTISLNLPPAMAGIRDSYIISESAHFSAMMDTYFGLSLEPCDKAEKEAIAVSAPFAEMDCWPAPGSVRQIGDTVVIKITDQDP